MNRPTRFRKAYAAVSSKLDYTWNEGPSGSVKKWTHRRFRRVSKQIMQKEIHDES